MKLYYFYKIACLDVNITDCYIGSTYDFKQRLLDHKSSCNNQNSKSYNHKKYQFIRSKGGWSNWIMFPIDVLETDNKIAVRQRETELMKLNNSMLNSYNAYTDIKAYKKEYHLNNKDYIHEQKNQKYICECSGHFTHTNKSQHIKSIKHQTFLCQQII